ncbi:phosphopantothenoylcysteine decarboxylase isoform X2 [Podarcis muralis]
MVPKTEMDPMQKNTHILVGVTGSVAALKLPILVSELLKIPGLWKKREDPVLHIDLRRWADLLLVAPLDANTLAKMANGLCDNLLTCVIRAWDLSKPLLFCPAMNTAMWEHPITAQQVDQLKSFGYVEIPCIVKKLICGDEGQFMKIPTKGLSKGGGLVLVSHNPFTVSAHPQEPCPDDPRQKTIKITKNLHMGVDSAWTETKDNDQIFPLGAGNCKLPFVSWK